MTEEKELAFDEEVRLGSVFTWIWRGKWLIIVLVLMAGGIAAFIGMRQPETHTAAALIEVGRVWSKPLQDIYLTVEVSNSPGFMQDVAVKTGVKPGHLARSVQVGAVESGVPHSLYPILIRVTAKSDAADESVRLAQSVADEIVERHAKLFDDALAPHLEHQRSLEQSLNGLGSSPSERDIELKIKTELDEAKANSTSPISTQRTHLAEKIVPGPTLRADVWRGAANAGVIAGIAGIVIACVIGYLRTL